MDTTSMLAQGTLLRNGTYRVEKHLASGGFGNTYLVRNVAFDELHAMKEFFMKGINMRNGLEVTVSVPDNHASYDSQMEKFKKEALRLRKLRNPHIVHVHDLFEEHGTVYYVMDFIDGESLGARMKRTGMPLSEEQAWKLLPQMLEALDTVHNEGIWHLDIKPGNIMLDKNDNAYLIDFGASKQVHANDGASVATSSALCYTPGYAPMEQVEQAMDKFGPWTDFYALGATLYYILTRQQPPSFTALTEADAFNFPPTVSVRMQDLIRWMMKPNRKDRPQSVADIRNYLQKPSTPSDSEDKADDATEMLSPKPKPAPKTVEKPAPARPTPSPSSEDDGDDAPKRSLSWLKYLLLVLVVAGIGVGVYFFMNNVSRPSSSKIDIEEEELSEYEILYQEGLDILASVSGYSDIMLALEKVEQLEAMEENDEDLEDEELSAKLRNYWEACADSVGHGVGYMKVKEVKFSNTESNGTVIDAEGSVLYASRMHYLSPTVYYYPVAGTEQNVTFEVKVADSNGAIVRGSSSPEGYSYGSNHTLAAITSSQPELQKVDFLGWGSANGGTYKADETYSFTIYYAGREIYTTKVRIY